MLNTLNKHLKRGNLLKKNYESFLKSFRTDFENENETNNITHKRITDTMNSFEQTVNNLLKNTNNNIEYTNDYYNNSISSLLSLLESNKNGFIDFSAINESSLLTISNDSTIDNVETDVAFNNLIEYESDSKCNNNNDINIINNDKKNVNFDKKIEKSVKLNKTDKQSLWRLKICTLNKIVSKSGKIFNYNLNGVKGCIARTDIAMHKNCGIFKICFEIKQLTNKYINGFGLCTNNYKLNKNETNWHTTNNYIMWHCDGISNNNKYCQNGILCGWQRKEKNIFYQSNYKFVGNPLPSLNKKDIISLIYDSNQNILQFELNGQKLNCCINNIVNKNGLYWCVGRKTGQIKVNIVDMVG